MISSHPHHYQEYDIIPISEDRLSEVSELIKRVYGEACTLDHGNNPEKIAAAREIFREENLAKLFNSAKSVFLGIEIEDEIVGVIGYQDHQPQDNTYFLSHLYVSLNYHGQGIGTALVNNMIDALTQDGDCRIFLFSSLSSICFYERYGFSKEKRTKIPSKDGNIHLPAYVMGNTFYKK